MSLSSTSSIHAFLSCSRSASVHLFDLPQHLSQIAEKCKLLAVFLGRYCGGCGAPTLKALLHFLCPWGGNSLFLAPGSVTLIGKGGCFYLMMERVPHCMNSLYFFLLLYQNLKQKLKTICATCRLPTLRCSNNNAIERIIIANRGWSPALKHSEMC